MRPNAHLKQLVLLGMMCCLSFMSLSVCAGKKFDIAVPLFPSDQGGAAGRIGRDDGVTVWGSFEKFNYAIGVFDGLQGGANTQDSLLYAARVAYQFLNKEQNPAYYTSSTYYGDLGDIFTLGFSAQSQSNGVGTAATAGDFFGVAVDILYEHVQFDASVVTVEAEYKYFDADITTFDLPPIVACFCLFDGNAFFITTAYLLSEPTGMGTLQPYLRYTKNSPSNDSSSNLSELGVNYIIAGHNLRFNANITSGDVISNNEDIKTFTFGVQLQI